MKEIIKTIDALESGDELAELIAAGAKIPIVVTGSSMLPFLRNKRDTVWLMKEENYKRGQILFFRRDNGMFVLHRIRRVYPDGRMLLNGDAQTACEIIRPDQALAVVYAVSRNGKTKPADCLLWKLRDLLWYPTRPLRPVIFSIYRKLRSLFRKATEQS
ncbi:MAG: S24/S26 family peptidase [Clostridia bacterium]|nr:S24/S26 family peptidase [Clostridia bacterium]